MMDATASNTLDSSSNKYPPQIKYILGNEICERYSFYGMRSILTIFMVQYLLFTKSNAEATYHMFVASAYFTPLLGGYIADRYWGKYKTILYLSLFYCIGHAVLAFYESETGLYVGLFLIALGAGGIKPCVSANVGDQFTKKNQHLIEKIFHWFYLSINFGSFFSTLITPWVLDKYGASWAFGIPGVLMFIATIIFWMGRKKYIMVPPTGKNPHGTLAVLKSAFKNMGKGNGFFGGALNDHPADAVDAVKSAILVGKIFIPLIFFWSLFDQHGSTWVLQATQMDLNVLGIDFKASQSSSLNPILVLILIPVFTQFVYPAVERTGYKLTQLRKMSIGMFFSGLSFVFMAMIQYRLDAGQQLSVAWQILPYLFLTIGELLISITALEFAYTQAPRSMKSTIMGIWFLIISLGNTFTGIVAKVNTFSGGNFFMFFAILTFIFGFVFMWIASTYQMRNYVEPDKN